MPTKTIEEFPERDALEATKPELAVIVGATFASGHKVQRGDNCGEITASKKLRRRTRAVAAGAGFAIDSAVGQVDDASIFVIGDVLKNGAGAVIGTVDAVDPVANTVTLEAVAAVAVAAGAAVLGSDGSQVSKAIAYDGSDGVGDTNGAVYIGGYLNEAKLRGLDATAKVELGGVSTIGGIFKF